MAISDATETALVNLRRTIYLTIMSSVDVEDCTHKLLKIQIQPGHEVFATLLLLFFLHCIDRDLHYAYRMLQSRAHFPSFVWINCPKIVHAEQSTFFFCVW